MTTINYGNYLRLFQIKPIKTVKFKIMQIKKFAVIFEKVIIRGQSTIWIFDKTQWYRLWQAIYKFNYRKLKSVILNCFITLFWTLDIQSSWNWSQTSKLIREHNFDRLFRENKTHINLDFVFQKNLLNQPIKIKNNSHFFRRRATKTDVSEF